MCTHIHQYSINYMAKFYISNYVMIRLTVKAVNNTTLKDTHSVVLINRTLITFYQSLIFHM